MKTPEARHSWSEADELVAYYLYRYGTSLLPFDVTTIADQRGIKRGSMDMRIRNFEAYAGTGALGHISKQSVRVFERHRNTPEAQLRDLAFPELGGLPRS